MVAAAASEIWASFITGGAYTHGGAQRLQHLHTDRRWHPQWRDGAGFSFGYSFQCMNLCVHDPLKPHKMCTMTATMTIPRPTRSQVTLIQVGMLKTYNPRFVYRHALFGNSN